jgi:hypothetical protein
VNGIFVLIPIMVLGVAVTGIISSVILKLQRMKLEEARLRAAEPGETEELAHQVAELRRELIDVHERLDFAERMIAQTRDRPALPPAS